MRFVSVAAILLAIMHVAFPKLAIDSTTVLLFALAVLPWLSPLLKSIELPGGVKLDFREAEKEAEKVGLLSATPKSAEPVYVAIADEDPNLALAGLRIELERKLRQIAEARGIQADRMSARALVERLSEAGVLSSNERGFLLDLIAQLNRAVHGAQLDANSMTFALEAGPRILAALEGRTRP